MSRIEGLGKGPLRALHSMQELTARERRRLITEIAQVRGLLPLLMKPRNKQKWSGEDKVQLAEHMKHLSALSPYLALLVLPGGFVALPALAWWLDRRRQRERSPQPAARPGEAE